jgi:ParB family chromosome partitioning protein
MEPIMIEVKNLEKSPQNARRTTSKASAEELRASILAHGLMQNLVVTEAGDGRYHVIAGGRRLDALRELQAEGKLPPEYAVPCQVAPDAHAFELSLAENTVRQAMHPADEFEAFVRLAEAGANAEAIAQRFGVSMRHVEKRMRLGRVAPELLDAYRADEITLECVMAFAITEDHEKQLEVYRSLLPWNVINHSEIRARLTETMLEATSKLACFVGLEAYHAAGGLSRADLLGVVYLESPELLHRLATEKLDRVRDELLAEGWKWVEATTDYDWNLFSRCGRIYAQPLEAPPELLAAKEQAEAEIDELQQALEETESDAIIAALDAAEARLNGIDEQLESLVAYDPEAMRSAGCYVTISHDGTLSVDKGLVRREDMKQAVDHRPAKPKGMPETLRHRLESYRLQVAQVELASHPLVALDLLAFTVARSVVAGQPIFDGPDVRLIQHSALPEVQREQTPAGEALSAIAEALPRNWLLPETEAEQFQAFLGLAERDRLAFLAYGVAMSLKPQLSTRSEGTASELALSMTDADVASYWRPTKGNYLTRITRDQLLALGSTLLGEPWALAHSRAKKGELAAVLDRAFAEPERDIGSSEQRHALARWLPEGMAFGAEVSESDVAEQCQAA